MKTTAIAIATLVLTILGPAAMRSAEATVLLTEDWESMTANMPPTSPWGNGKYTFRGGTPNLPQVGMEAVIVGGTATGNRLELDESRSTGGAANNAFWELPRDYTAVNNTDELYVAMEITFTSAPSYSGGFGRRFAYFTNQYDFIQLSSRAGGAPNTVNIGIRSTSLSSSFTDWYSTDFPINQTITVVMAAVRNGNSYQARAWINPTGANPSHDLEDTDTFGDALSAFQLNQYNDSSGGMGVLEIDNVAIGTTLADVLPTPAVEVDATDPTATQEIDNDEVGVVLHDVVVRAVPQTLSVTSFEFDLAANGGSNAWLGEVALYEDGNDNGVPDAGEQIAMVTAPMGTETLTPLAPVTIPVGTTTRFLLVGTFNGSASTGDVLQIQVTDLTFATAGLAIMGLPLDGTEISFPARLEGSLESTGNLTIPVDSLNGLVAVVSLSAVNTGIEITAFDVRFAGPSVNGALPVGEVKFGMDMNDNGALDATEVVAGLSGGAGVTGVRFNLSTPIMVGTMSPVELLIAVDGDNLTADGGSFNVIIENIAATPAGAADGLTVTGSTVSVSGERLKLVGGTSDCQYSLTAGRDTVLGLLGLLLGMVALAGIRRRG